MLASNLKLRYRIPSLKALLSFEFRVNIGFSVSKPDGPPFRAIYVSIRYANEFERIAHTTGSVKAAGGALGILG